MEKVYTRGNVIVNDIQVGDVHYEYDYGVGIRVEVISKPVRNDDGYWTWNSEDRNGNVISYGVHEQYSHYGPKLYDYEAYQVNNML